MTKANLVLGAAAMLFAAGCLVLVRNLSTERNHVRALETQLAQLPRDVKRPEAAPPEPPAQSSAVPPVTTSPATATSMPAADKPAAEKDGAELDRQRRLYADPVYRAAEIASIRLEQQTEYPQLAAELGLSKEEADRLLDLLAEQSLRQRESATKQLQSGDDWEQWQKKLSEQQEQERRALLGEERFQAWTEYVKGAGARELVSQLRTELATSSSPLSEVQVKPLAQALAAEQQRSWAELQENHSGAEWTDETPMAEKVAYMKRHGKLIEESLTRSREVGAIYLDSTQQRIFNGMLERQKERARAQSASWQAMWEAEQRARAASRSR